MVASSGYRSFVYLKQENNYYSSIKDRSRSKLIVETFRNVTLPFIFTQNTISTKLDDFFRTHVIEIFKHIAIASSNATIGTISLRVILG
mmetsp:Transcript_32948/g.96156  ORF Transcript_32948/g.96156 Transcript_32948/m.96156 type:complete len:89 (-) Transcript_32948:369-635(-)